MIDRPTRLTVDARYLRRPAVGISVYLADFIAELAGGSYAVTLLTNDPTHARRLGERFPGCEVDVLAERREVPWEQRALPRHLQAAVPDIHLAGANRGLPLRSPPHTRLALIMHDLIPLRMPRSHLLADPFAAGRFLFGTAVSLARADLVITNSRSTADDVRRLRPRVPRVVRYPSVPEIPTLQTGPPAGWPAEYLLYCGGADRRKNVDGLVAAHAEYRRRGGRLPLMIIGFGFDGLRERTRDRGAADAVLFAGVVSEAVKWQAVSHAQAVLYPSSWEGFGLPILEALAVGTPVLAGRGGAQPEVGGDVAAYVDVDERDSLVDGIRQVLDPAWREIVRRRGPAQVALLRAAHRSAGEILDPLAADGAR